MKFLLQIVPGLLLLHSAVAQQIQYPVSKEKAKQIVAEVLKTSPIIDGHSDVLAWYFGCVYKKLKHKI